jgi:RNA polymerase sigma-70 factor (ECF subfamily)
MLLQLSRPEDKSHSNEMCDRLYWFGRRGYLRALCAGEKQTWDEFVVGATPLVNAVVSRALAVENTGEDPTADVVQEVFAYLSGNNFKLLKRYEPSRANLSTWVAVIAWYIAIGARNRRSGESPRSRYERL